MSPFSLPATFDASNRLCTSWILPPGALFFQRFLYALYAFVTTFFILGWDGTHFGTAGQYFSYFTSLTYWGLAFYNAFAAFHTFTYWRSGTPMLARWPRVLQEMHSIFYSTIVVFPFLVTIVYWAILFSSFSSTFSTWSNTSQHALNSVFAFTEIVIPRTEPMAWYHLIPLIILLALYLALAYLTHATQGFYVYSFLDDTKNSHGVVAGYIIGILVATIIIFIIVRYVIWARIWLVEKKLGMTGKFSARDRVGSEEHAAKEGINMQTLVSDDGKIV